MNRKTVERGVGGWDWGLGIGHWEELFPNF